jgi:hypothetical protein
LSAIPCFANKEDALSKLRKAYSKEIVSHIEWLQSFKNRYKTRWEKLLKTDPEAAICEATSRALLQSQGVTVRPNEDLSIGGPDYLCRRGDKDFYLEVTCITKDKVTEKAELDERPSSAGHYRLLTSVFRYELSQKVRQCSGLDKPCLVVLGTLHFQGGALCFRGRAVEDLLTGTGEIVIPYDSDRGEAVGDPHQITNLSNSAFIKFETCGGTKIEFARSPISAVLLCGFGCQPPVVVGALHPNPKHPFERGLLPDLKFARLADGWQQTGQIEVEWV